MVSTQHDKLVNVSPPSPHQGSEGESPAMIQLLLEAETLHQCGCWCLDHTNGTVLWSPQAQALLGLDNRETPSVEQLLAAVAPDERDVLAATLRQSWLSGVPFRLEHAVQLADGSQRLVLHQGTTLCDKNGQPERTVATLQDVGKQDGLRQQLDHAIHRDPVTGLANKNGVLRYLRQRLRQVSYNTQIALISLDLDGFQNINERYGVETGNHILRWVADWLVTQLQPSDWLARLDADNFLYIRSDHLTSLADALALAKHLQNSLRDAMPTLDPPIPLRLSACAGVTVAPDHGSDANDLLQCANTALVEAKTKGKSSLRAYSTAISQRIRERLDLEHRLSRAIDQQELFLNYQPQWDRHGRLLGAEALLRWRTQRGETISPSRFIPLAEQCGLIESIGTWVLEHALTQLAAWMHADLQLPRLAINVSAKQLEARAPSIDEVVLSACAHRGIAPDRLELEITETALLSQPETASCRLQALADAGVRLAIDDFGTGFSSLAILQQLPLHTLKVDRSFVEGVGERQADQSIIKATILMAHELGLTCLAEGVETQAQIQRLLELGCDSFQGFLLGGPLSASGMTELLQKSVSCWALTSLPEA
ncbi:MAG: GGDEF and EAL domain-containing protein [Cyanobacteriota bacterium]|nr:GGDEF and EAL domain-containing protein [Cyanobacteriota bacterium]